LENDTMTVVAQAANSAGSVPVAAHAFHSRAPSRCTGRPCAPAASASARSSPNGVTTPPAPLCVFSRHTSDARGACGESGRTAAASASASITSRPGARPRAGLHAAERREAGVLPVHHVRLRVDQHLGAAPREQPHGGLVGHGARREEQRARLA
jgi:hypothetical protein